MTDPVRAARARQLRRLPAGEKPPAPRAALALAKSKAYQAAADAPATVRAYAWIPRQNNPSAPLALKNQGDSLSLRIKSHRQRGAR